MAGFSITAHEPPYSGTLFLSRNVCVNRHYKRKSLRIKPKKYKFASLVLNELMPRE